MESTFREYNSPRKRHLGGFVANTWTLVTPTIRSIKCKQSPVYEVFLTVTSTFSLPIVTKHELGLPFPPRNLPIKFSTNPSTIFSVIVVTDKHTNRQTHKRTPAKRYTLAFAGEQC